MTRGNHRIYTRIGFSLNPIWTDWLPYGFKEKKAIHNDMKLESKVISPWRS
jgi:hypothetical protein